MVTKINIVLVKLPSRNNVGNLCDQVSGPGSVNMIKKLLMVKLNVLMLMVVE
jgi:hypothetical protein